MPKQDSQRSRRSYTEEFKQNIIAQWRAGLSFNELAEQNKISDSIIRRWVRQSIESSKQSTNGLSVQQSKSKSKTNPLPALDLAIATPARGSCNANASSPIAPIIVHIESENARIELRVSTSQSGSLQDMIMGCLK